MGLAEVPEAIREALDTLQVVIRSSADDQRRLVPACVQVSEWAERQGYLGTALAYAQGCALADPDNPELACRVGRLALEHAEYTRADSWYRRALALARRSRSWDTYGLCFIGLGNQNRQRGRLPAAEQYFRHAPARAKQDRRSMLAAMADHDPYALALRRGHIERAEQYARRARGQYPPEDPHLFRLATDVALLLDPVLDHLRPVPHLAEVAVPPPDQIETPVAELRDHCSSGERARLAHAVVGIL